MKKFFAFTTFFTVSFIANVFAQTDAEMKSWQNYMTPGEVHKMMAQADGEWTEEIIMWMDPAKPATKTTATTKNEMIMGGRYQLSKTTGTMMGMPFEGMSIMGYDNLKKILTSVWIDNMGTGTITMEGAWDDKTNSITLKGKGVDPMTGKDSWMKQVIKFVGNDSQEMAMFENKDGKERQWK